jgi:hypothetical protein
MKYALKFASVMILGLMTSLAFADTFRGPTELNDKDFDDLTITGSANLKDIKAKTLKIDGPTKFHDLEVTESANINGPVGGSEDGKFKNLTIQGPADMKDVIVEDFEVKGHTTVMGPLSAKDGKFKDVTITSSEISLEHVSVNNILIKKGGDKTETVIIGGDSEINGNITFESGAGIVMIDRNKNKFKGSITGGTEKNK